MVSGVGIMAVATQTADEVQDPVAHKVQIAHWLETGLWVNPYLLLAGAVTLLVGAVLYATIGSSPRMRRYTAIAMSSLIVIAAIAIFVVWQMLDRSPNLTESWPQ